MKIMKKILFLFLLIITVFSCDKKSEVEKKVDSISVNIEIERFDKLFFETSTKDLGKLKTRFPFFFPNETPDNVWIERMQNPLWRELYTEVQKKFPDFEPQKKEFDSLFKRLKYHFPKTKTPKVITIIGEMDYENKVILSDSLLIISLEMYLGKNHKFYEFPAYLKQNFEPKQIMPNVVSSVAFQKISPSKNINLLSQMIYFGKEMYLKDLLLPNYSDAEKMGYTKEQNLWCIENESYIWRYFIENQLLFDNDAKLENRFINPAPFSKFYLEIDNESPGGVGVWIGWQIVKSFVKNNEIPLETMLKMDEKQLFEKSKYKPNKIENE